MLRKRVLKGRKLIMKKIKSLVTIFLSCVVVMTMLIALAGPTVVGATSTDNSATTTSATTASTEKATSALDAPYGSENDINVSGVFTQSAGANGQAGIGFSVSLSNVGEIKDADGNIRSDDNNHIVTVRPKMNTSGPFVVDNAMYAIAYNDGSKVKLDCGFVFNVKGDVKTAYYPIAFEVEYIKDGTTYRVDKSVDIALYGIEEETTTASDAAVSVPRIIVTGFETNPEKVMAGDEFELTIHLQNTSNKTSVSNVKVALSSANNEFLPSSGSSTEFIRSIGTGVTKDIVINMKAQASLEQKPYVLALALDYEGEKNTPYTASESISIPIYQEAKMMISSMEIMPGSVEVYGQANVMFSINNTGKATLFNVKVYTDPECTTVSSEKSFVGNITAGSTGYADFMINGAAPTMDDGIVKIIVEYEDANGEVGTFETEANIYVYEMVYEDFGEMGDDFGFEDPGMVEEKGFPWIPVAIGVVVVIVVIVVTIKIIKSKKRKAEEEDLEDELS